MNMPILTQLGNSEQSMNTLDISELVQSRHDKVKQSTERLVERGVIAQPPMGSVVKTVNGRNYETEVYIFTGEKGKRDSIIVVAQLCPEFTARLVDRWQELENKVAFDITNPAHLLQAIEIQAKQNIALTHELSIVTPKAKALDVLSNSHGTETVDNCAHAMGIQPRKTLRPWMEKNNWIHKDKDGQWRAKSERITAGHLKEASRVITDTSGTPRHKVTVYVTPKGKTLLTTRLIQAGIIKGDAA